MSDILFIIFFYGFARILIIGFFNVELKMSMAKRHASTPELTNVFEGDGVTAAEAFFKRRMFRIIKGLPMSKDDVIKFFPHGSRRWSVRSSPEGLGMNRASVEIQCGGRATPSESNTRR